MPMDDEDDILIDTTALSIPGVPIPAPAEPEPAPQSPGDQSAEEVQLRQGDSDPSDSWSPLTRYRVRLVRDRLASGRQPSEVRVELAPLWGVSGTTFQKYVRLAREQMERDVGDTAPAQLRLRAVAIAEQAVEIALGGPRPRLDPAIRAAELMASVAKDIESRRKAPDIHIHTVADARALFIARLEKMAERSGAPAKVIEAHAEVVVDDLDLGAHAPEDVEIEL